MGNAKLIGLTLCSILSAATAAHAQRGTIVRIDPRLLIARCHVSVPAPRRGANASAVPADYDGDGVMDVALKQDDGEWSIDYAKNGFGAWDDTYAGFGPAYFTPVPGDYDGDGKADLATKDDSGAWYIDYAANGFGAWDQIVYGYGDGSVRPVPADYDGDCKVDLAIVDTAGTWYIDYAADGFNGWNAIYPNYGTNIVPVPADYDGDGRADLAVKDNTSGHWIIDFASNGFGHWDASYPGFGGAEFAPVPADFDGDGKTDLASRDTWDDWYIDYAANGFGSWDVIVGGYGPSASYQPVPADYDGDHKADLSSHTDAGDWLIDFASDGFGAWNQYWNSYVTVSVGRAVTSDDVRKFDSKWMQPQDANGRADAVDGGTYWHAERSYWAYGEWMESMLRMYENTRQTRYLDEAVRMIDSTLANRDDRHPAGPVFDEVRGKVFPAWGGRGIGAGGLYTDDETTSNVLLHPFAVFARIVADDPTLQDPNLPYGRKAISYADAATQTIRALIEQVHFQTVDGNLECYLALNPKLATAVNDQMCDAAGNAARAPDGSNKADVDQQVSNCKNYWRGAGYPMAHNEENLFLLNLVEVSHVLDSAFYRANSTISANEETDRVMYPLLVSYGFRNFRRHVWVDYDLMVSGISTVPDPNSIRYAWNHVDDVPGLKLRPDDASHAVVSMRFITILNRELSRLNARVASAGGPAIALTQSDLQLFAATFVRMTVSGHVADNVGGRDAANPVGSLDGLCDGWLGLSGVDNRIYDRCHDMMLRVIDGEQPNLSMAAHTSLLAAKTLRYPAPPKLVIGPRQAAALLR